MHFFFRLTDYWRNKVHNKELKKSLVERKFLPYIPDADKSCIFAVAIGIA